MQGTSHIIIGAASAIIVNAVAPFAPVELSLSFAAVIGANVLGSLAPDIDSDESTLRHATGTARSQGFLGRLVSAVMPSHRGWVHSPIMAAALVGLAVWLGWGWALAFAIGWAAHIVADTAMGVIGLKNGGIAEYVCVIGVCLLAFTLK